MDDLSGRVAKAVKHFWTTRGRQARNQGSSTGRKDTGARSAVTGGRQLDGFVTHLWAAYREGAFAPSQHPWLGYLFLLEDCERSLSPVKVTESHFAVFKEFRDASYAKRYEILLTKLLRERLYDGACLILSNGKNGLRGKYHEPSKELQFQNFAASLLAHAMAFAKTRGS